jgi:Zn-dependent protease
MGRGWSIPLCRVFGIKLELHITFLFLLAFIAWDAYRMDGWVAALGFTLYFLLGFSCVVLHELGHSLAARAWGIPTLRIWLLPIGGIAELAEMPRRPRLEFFISIAGPAVNFAIVAFVAVLLVLTDQRRILALDGHAWSQAILGFGWTGIACVLLLWNTGMGLFNLLPIFPMDGGRILRSVLYSRLRNYLRATRIAVMVSKPIILVLVVAAALHQQWMLLLLLLLVMLLGELEWRVVRQRERYADLPLGNFTARTYHCYPPGTTLGEALDIVQFHQPAELVLTENGALVGIFTGSEVLRLASIHTVDTPLRGLLPVPSPLQMNWPLSMLGQQLESRSPRSYPVFRHDQLIGVFRVGQLDQLLEFHRLRLRRQSDPVEAQPPIDPGPILTRTRTTPTAPPFLPEER